MSIFLSFSVFFKRILLNRFLNSIIYILFYFIYEIMFIKVRIQNIHVINYSWNTCENEENEARFRLLSTQLRRFFKLK